MKLKAWNTWNNNKDTNRSGGSTNFPDWNLASLLLFWNSWFISKMFMFVLVVFVFGEVMEEMKERVILQ